VLRLSRLFLFFGFFGLPLFVQATVPLGSDVNLAMFADAQLLWGESGTNSGFTLNDGALYLSRNHLDTEFFVGLPFTTQNAPNPTSLPNGNSGQSTSADLNFAGAKAQAYIGHKYGNHVFWRAGQFDGLYGYEGNSTKELFFSNQGQLWGELPTVQTGLTVGLKPTEQLTLQAVVANHHDEGQKADGEGLDGGVKATLEKENWNAGGGVLLMDKRTGEEYLVEAYAEVKLHKWTAAVDLAVKKESAENVAGTGALISVLYALNPMWSIGARVDGVQLMDRYYRFQPSLGVNARMSEDLVAKATYSHLESEINEGDGVIGYDYTTFNIVYVF
jgi:hypothetical protein